MNGTERLEERIEGLRLLLEAHTEQDHQNFLKLEHKIDSLADKLDALLLREAEGRGEQAALKRVSATISTVVSTIIAVLGLVVQYIVGNP